ncbi:MAG: sigma-70 family RNA polymerase sigma factor [Acetatifactor sp.]|nr:sigma-70 family RNA polymerase sigma factor [Acetatifactor sp.]
MKQIEFCEQVSQYRYQFYITAYALLRNEADAEDAVCNAILNGYEHLGQLKNPKKFKSWMLTITKNEALKLRCKRMGLPGDEAVEQLLPPAYDNHNELWDIVQTLKEEYRIVIVLFYYNDLSLRDISDVLDIPIGTVKSRLDRGRKLLKDALGE